MEATDAKIVSHFDEDGAEWIKLKPYVGKSGFILEKGKTYIVLLMPDKEVVWSPNECVELVKFDNASVKIDIQP